MPILKIFTNLPRNKVPNDFVKNILPVLSKAVKKPEEQFICVVISDVQLCMFGDSSPAAISNLESIGNLGPEENRIISSQLSEFIQKELGITPQRFLISFYDLELHNIGINGTTVLETRK